MKLRSTTPVSRSTFTAQLSAAIGAVILLVTVPIQLFTMRPASADAYDVKIQALKDKVASYQQQANALREQANSLQNTLAQLAAEKAEIQTQIDIYQAQYDQLVADIKATEQRIEDNKRSSGELIVNSSLSDDVPLIVRLAASENLADYIDGEADRMTVRDAIVQKTKENEELKKQLEVKQVEVERVLNEQKGFRTALQNKEAEQAQILAETQGNEAAYQTMISSSNEEMRSLREEQARVNAASLASSGVSGLPAPTGGTGGYPYVGGWSGGTYGFSPLVDPWGFYYQQCTSYVAWKIYDSGRAMPAWGKMYQPGHAKYWAGFAANAGIGTGSTPRKGAAAIMTGGDYGHSMYVEEDYGNGRIRVSDYNLGFDGQFRTYDRSASGVIYIYF